MEPTKRKKIMLYSLMLIAMMAIGYIAYRKIKDQKAYTDTRAAQYNCRQARTASFPMAKGAIGWQVELLQRICNNCPDFGCNLNIATDGIWGEATEAAFQLCFAKNLIAETDFEQILNFYKQYAILS